MDTTYFNIFLSSLFCTMICTTQNKPVINIYVIAISYYVIIIVPTLYILLVYKQKFFFFSLVNFLQTLYAIRGKKDNQLKCQNL